MPVRSHIRPVSQPSFPVPGPARARLLPRSRASVPAPVAPASRPRCQSPSYPVTRLHACPSVPLCLCPTHRLTAPRSQRGRPSPPPARPGLSAAHSSPALPRASPHHGPHLPSLPSPHPTAAAATSPETETISASSPLPPSSASPRSPPPARPHGQAPPPRRCAPPVRPPPAKVARRPLHGDPHAAPPSRAVASHGLGGSLPPVGSSGLRAAPWAGGGPGGSRARAIVGGRRTPGWHPRARVGPAERGSPTRTWAGSALVARSGEPRARSRPPAPSYLACLPRFDRSLPLDRTARRHNGCGPPRSPWRCARGHVPISYTLHNAARRPRRRGLGPGFRALGCTTRL